LVVTTLLVVCIGALLPQSALTGALGFAPLPSAYFLFLAAVLGTYLTIVELVKRHVIHRLLPRAVA
jgi:Mg2+-importing ATPase